jgi:adenylate kinase
MIAEIDRTLLDAWITGSECPWDPSAVEPDRAWRLVMLGAPGVGKGTLAELLHKRLGAAQLSTGDVFRAIESMPIEEQSPAIKTALEYMVRGQLAPDQTVIDLVRERRECLRWPAGFLLDGFPRTVSQAEALSEMLAEMDIQLDSVIDLFMPIDEIVTRLEGRRTCANCKTVYHVTSRPSKVPGVCDKCGGRLIQRDDDRPEAIRVRMEAYERSTAPLMDYYHKKDLLITIDAHGKPEEILQRTMKKLGA